MIGPRCVGACQVQESACPPYIRVLPSAERRAILFHVFYKKPIIVDLLGKLKGGSFATDEMSISALWKR